jgi:hypothetical protein
MTDKKITPDQALTIIKQVCESMFGSKKWGEMVEKADTDMQNLLGVGVTSKRDRIIFHYALHIGISYGVAYSRALQQAQRPWNIVRSFFTRRERK